MVNLLQELVNELTTNENLKSSSVIMMVLESINNSKLLGIQQNQIFENSLSLLEKLSKEMANKNLHEVVDKFKKLGKTSSKSLENMAKEAGLSFKLKSIKESQLYEADPIVKQIVSKLDEALTKNPEFKVLPSFVNALSNYSYDKTINECINSVNSYIEKNRVKLEIMNSIYDMRSANAVVYSQPSTILEESLMNGIETSDSLKMKLGNHIHLPNVKNLINMISMHEAKSMDKFNIGVGLGNTKVKSVIAPFCKVSEDSAILFTNGQFIQVYENRDPELVSEQVILERLKPFHETCKAFHILNFSQNESSIYTTGKKVSFGFSINEKGNLSVKINDTVVEDLNAINISELLLLESLKVRQAFNIIFENIDYIANIEFAKNIVNENFGLSSLVFNFGENIYVFENANGYKTTKKMSDTGFYNYVLESYKYDISELYSIKLEEKAKTIKALDSQKSAIEENLNKLQKTIDNIDTALSKDSTISQENIEKLNELKMAIEKNMNSLKEQYIMIDQAKKKV